VNCNCNDKSFPWCHHNNMSNKNLHVCGCRKTYFFSFLLRFCDDGSRWHVGRDLQSGKMVDHFHPLFPNEVHSSSASKSKVMFDALFGSNIWVLNFIVYEMLMLFLGSISSTFYRRVFCTKFWRQKLQSCAKCFRTKFWLQKRAFV